MQRNRGADPNRDPGKGAGKNLTRRGENVGQQKGKEAGRHEAGKKGGRQRPAGKSTARDRTSVDPQETITRTGGKPRGGQ